MSSSEYKLETESNIKSVLLIQQSVSISLPLSLLLPISPLLLPLLPYKIIQREAELE